MNHFLKVFFIAFLCLMLMFLAGLYTYNKTIDEGVVAYKEDKEDNFEKNNEENLKDNNEDNEQNILENEEDNKLTPLERAISNSNRINFLVLGIEKNNKPDAIFVISFDSDNKKMDVISIPRNTYYNEKDNNEDYKYLSDNYSYYENKEFKNTIENMIDVMNIDHYIALNYNDVEEIINIIGGVEIDVPFDMEYEDISENPPLIIDIKKGKQILDGEESIKYLRWKNNNENTVSYPDGELGRIKAHQKFILSAIKKSINFNFPNIVKRVFQAVDTDISNTDALLYASKLIGLKVENVDINILPGNLEAKDVNGEIRNYYFYDKKKGIELINKIYDINE